VPPLTANGEPIVGQDELPLVDSRRTSATVPDLNDQAMATPAFEADDLGHEGVDPHPRAVEQPPDAACDNGRERDAESEPTDHGWSRSASCHRSASYVCGASATFARS